MGYAALWRAASSMRWMHQRLGLETCGEPAASAGQEVFTPTPSGVGERIHLAGPEVDLDTHIADIVNVILHEDLERVVLVGWSYGGKVVSGASTVCLSGLPGSSI